AVVAHHAPERQHVPELDGRPLLLVVVELVVSELGWVGRVRLVSSEGIVFLEIRLQAVLARVVLGAEALVFPRVAPRSNLPSGRGSTGETSGSAARAREVSARRRRRGRRP